MRLADRRILLIVSGGIAAYKTIELARLLRREGAAVTAVLTRAAEHFVTPLSLQTITESKVYTDIWSLTDEHEMGHIQLSRAADLLVVAPASADFLAQMAAGLGSDLATTLLLATNKPVLAAPAMNVQMWHHAATQQNIATLTARGIHFVGPEIGEMACHETGLGRLAEAPTIRDAIIAQLVPQSLPLRGRHAIVTSGPTHEAIDPVRYLANRSSGKQGHAIAGALAANGASVTLIHGPALVPAPAGTRAVAVETAAEMHAAVRAALPADIFIAAAAVADWRPTIVAAQKHKKVEGLAPPVLELLPTVDILADIAAPGPLRPGLVIGFAAETEALHAQASAKRKRKNCDWLIANDVSLGTTTMGGDTNTITLITDHGMEAWPTLSKAAIAQRLAELIAAYLEPRAPK